jgi:hypothetical protein
MADANEKTDTVKAEFIQNYRGTAGCFDAGRTYDLDKKLFAAFEKALVCKEVKTETAGK